MFKRTDAFLHGNWLEYIYRIALHNALFPETRLEFRGLMDVPQDQGLGGSGGLYSVVSQTAIRAVRGATRAEVEAEMEKRGFSRYASEDYYNPDTGIVVQDLHDENVVISPRGSVVVFDPIPVMAKMADFANGGMLQGRRRPSWLVTGQM